MKIALLAGLAAAMEFQEMEITDVDLNQKPVVGILAFTLEDDMHKDPRFDGYEAYIMKAYVQYF